MFFLYEEESRPRSRPQRRGDDREARGDRALLLIVFCSPDAAAGKRSHVRVPSTSVKSSGSQLVDLCALCWGFFVEQAGNSCLNHDLNVSKPSEYPPSKGKNMPKRLGENSDCQQEHTSCDLNGFSNGSRIGSTVLIVYIGDKSNAILYTLYH